MIQYSARAAAALGFLKRPYNDIEVFVEDTSCPNMWVRLLERAVPKGLRVSSVNLLGGRDKVLEACALDQADDGRRKLYIVDGDFDFLQGKGKRRLKFLHRIPCYCVENLLTKNTSVTEAAFNCCTGTNYATLQNKLNNLFSGLEILVRRLFVVYATCTHLGTGLRTVANGIYPYITKINGRSNLDEHKLRRAITTLVRDAIIAKGALAFSSARRKIQERERTLPLEKVVSGKDFIFPLIWVKLKEIKDFSVHLDHFKVHLANAFDPASDLTLKRRLAEMV
jgi:hypothetical protein